MLPETAEPLPAPENPPTVVFLVAGIFDFFSPYGKMKVFVHEESAQRYFEERCRKRSSGEELAIFKVQIVP